MRKQNENNISKAQNFLYRIYPQPKSIVSLNGNILSMIGK